MSVSNAGEKQPLVSVIMSFHDGRDTLSDAIASILLQTYQNWELILINDGSSDGAERVLRDFSDQRIRVYDDGKNRGLPARLNQGVKLARGQYIARMDVDDIAFPERFARQVAYLQEHTEVDLLASSVLMIDNQQNAIGIMSAGRSHRNIARQPWHGFPMPHPTWMGRAEWFRKHPYDELAKKGQDQVLLYRNHSNSRYDGLPDVLLAYRYDCLSLRKTFWGRYYYLKEVAANGGVYYLCRGMLAHVLAASRDIVSILLGLDSKVIKKASR